MKALKITLLLALFLSVSSQTDKKPIEKSTTSYQTYKTHYDLLAHNKSKVVVPKQG